MKKERRAKGRRRKAPGRGVALALQADLSLLVAWLSLCSVEYDHAAEPVLCITLMKSRQCMFRVGKAPCAFGLGQKMGGSLPAAREGGHTPSHSRLSGCASDVCYSVERHC
jgi:hypothetical protein